MRVQLSPAHIDLRVDAQSLSRARAEVAGALRDWGVTDARAIEGALVVVSELIGNALRHGGTLIAVELDRSPAGVVVSVLDSSSALPQQRSADADSEHGRGLQLISAFSAAWGAQPHRRGKRVWALLQLPA